MAQPVYGTRVLWGEDIEVVYALPPESPKGIVLLLHACTHNALKFFSASDSCPSCLGLAEELHIVRLVLSRGYAALAVTCHDQSSGCWSESDLPRLQMAISNFRTTIPPGGFIASTSTSTKLPIVAIGASSGGHLAAKVAVEGLADAALVMVMSLRPPLQNRFAEHTELPLFFAPMPRDRGTYQRVQQNYQALQGSGTVVLDETSCVPLAVTPSYLVGRVPGMTQDAAKRIVQALRKAGHLQEDYMLAKDPTRSNWRDILQKIDHDKYRSATTPELLWGQFLLAPGKSPVAKALHRAWAFHEYCSEAVLPALDYFENEFQRHKKIKLK
jgi:hypothetical protein